MTNTLDNIVIRSQDRDSGTRSDFNVQIQISLDCSRYTLKEAKFVHTFYNLRNALVVFNDGVVRNVVLNGNYNAVELAADIDSQLPAAFVITYNAITQRLVFSNVAPFTITFANSYDASVLGFTSLLVTSGAGLVITAPFAPELQRYKNIYIFIQEMGTSSVTSNSSATFVVPVNVNKDQYIVYDMHQFHQFVDTLNQSKQKQLRIQVIGDDGQTIPASEMSEWSMILSYYSKLIL